MGIVRFFYWLYNNHRESLLQLFPSQDFSNLNLEVDSYLLDLNAIIHPVCQKMYNYGSKKDRMLHRKNRIPNEKQVFSELCKTIDDLKNLVKPRKQLYIAIDGVAGMSKAVQQRARRFKSSKERDPNQIFDSNKITTGSEFMYNLSKYIHIFIKNKMENDISWANIEVIFSNEKVEGEGEHKLIHHIKNNRTKGIDMVYCIHSPDADLIMQTVGIREEIYILRENIYDNLPFKYFIVNVGIFRNIIIEQLKWSSEIKKYNEDQVVYDFVLMCFLLGNDFLPHIPSLEISNDGIEIMFSVYPDIAKKCGHIVYRNKGGDLCLNTESLFMIFKKISDMEKELLARKASARVKFPDTLLIKHCVDNRIESILNSTSSIPSTSGVNVDFDNYRINFYKDKMNNIDPYEVCQEYFKGLLFVIRYYIDEIPDWHWYYPYNYSPFFIDMSIFINDFDGEMKFDKNRPFKPFEQLLAVLPPQSSELLPKSCRELVTSSNSPIIEYYPTEFEVDLEGKKQEYEGQPILPFIDVNKLKKCYNNVKDNFDDMENKRNSSGKNMIYKNINGNIDVKFFL